MLIGKQSRNLSPYRKGRKKQQNSRDICIVKKRNEVQEAFGSYIEEPANENNLILQTA